MTLDKSGRNIYGVAALLHLICLVIPQLGFSLLAVTKLSLMPILMYCVYRVQKHRKVLILALFFSFLGDSFMLFREYKDYCFLLGLGSFLITHVLYVMLFVKKKEQLNSLRSPLSVSVIVTLVAYSITLFTSIKANLGPMVIPVLAYIFVILTMAVMALSRREIVNKDSYRLVLLGAVLFMISDSVIAIDKFYAPFALSGVVIMSTYILAQYFIVKGLLEEKIKLS